MKTFHFYFGASLLHNVLSNIDNSSKTLQHTRLNAAEGQCLVRMTTTTLKSIGTEEMYKLLWQKIIMQANYRKQGKIRWAKLSHFSRFSRVPRKFFHEYKRLSLMSTLAKVTWKYFRESFNEAETPNAKPSESFHVYSIAEPTLPRKCEAPRRYEVGVGTGVTPSSLVNHFKPSTMKP